MANQMTESVLIELPPDHPTAPGGFVGVEPDRAAKIGSVDRARSLYPGCRVVAWEADRMPYVEPTSPAVVPSGTIAASGGTNGGADDHDDGDGQDDKPGPDRARTPGGPSRRGRDAR